MIFNLQHANLEIDTIVLDLNGTLCVHGKIVAGARERIAKLRKLGFKIVLLSGDQRGTAVKLCKPLGIECIIARSGKEKENHMALLGKNCAAIGNARIDIGTFRYAKLSILTLQAEGIHTGALKYADIIVPSINDALDLFLDHDALVATLKE